jgi:hypothetical protein
MISNESTQITFDKIQSLTELKKLGIESISTINADGSVDVQGSVRIPTEYTKIPIQSGHVFGGFFCNGTKITSLLGAPRHVAGSFLCSNTKITSLIEAPRHVGGDCICSGTKITSLLGAPHLVAGNFVCNDTKITSLIEAPRHVGGDFYCHDTLVESLHDIHSTHAKWVIGNRLVLPTTCTHVLGLAYIPGVKRVQLEAVGTFEVIHDVFEWQEKLFALGLVKQAQL